MRILFVASEGLPFSKTGGLADVVEALPKALVARGHEVAVVLPRYRGTKATAIVMPSLTIPIGTRLRFPAVADGTILNGVRYFFVTTRIFRPRRTLWRRRRATTGTTPSALANFAKPQSKLPNTSGPPISSIATIGKLRSFPFFCAPHIRDDPVMKDLPVVFTIHNMGYQGQFAKDVLDRARNSSGYIHPRRN